MSDPSEPLVVEAWATKEFIASARAVCEALNVDDSGLAQLGSNFQVVIDGNGVLLNTASPHSRPVLSIGWPIIGRLRDDWVRQDDAGPLEVIAGMLFLGSLTFSRDVANQPVLCIPISSRPSRPELRLTVPNTLRLSIEADKRRPRPKWGPMLQWA